MAAVRYTALQTQQANVPWNLNRQMAFSVGAALLLMVFNLLLDRLGSTLAYHLSFALAALLGLAPLARLHTLPQEKPQHA